jgi:hypothetical protein
MTPLEQRTKWMRHAALLAAECLVRLPENAPLDPRAPYAADRAAWDELAANRPPGDLSDWLMAALTAAERFPEAAAAFSILAEDERLTLPPPVSPASPRPGWGPSTTRHWRWRLAARHLTRPG